jgi:23S rRNA (uracil1939-C5)-methyltransferase
MGAMRAKIEKLVYGGEGIARENGETLFVPFVLPGEEVEVEITERKKKLLRGHVTRLLNASALRAEPRCPHFGVCGGCDYQHISYEAQLEFKKEILRETLRRIGHVDWHEEITVHRSPPWQYRNRVQWKVRPLADARGGQSPIGYFRARSSALCPVETCSIISPLLLGTFQTLREALANGNLPATLREIEAFANASDNELLLTVICSSVPCSAESLLQTLAQILPAAKSILLHDAAGGRMALHGPGFLNYDVLQKSFRVGHLSFFQVNRFLIEEIAGSVRALAGDGDLAFDLYAGVGLFAALLAERFSEVAAVEADPASARDLENVARASHNRIGVHNQPTSIFLSKWKNKRASRAPDIAVIDPPRAGLEGGVAEQLMAEGSRKIIYVSCDPSTLARDLAKLTSHVYTLSELHLFDMFPQTYHIESVAFLERAR